MKNDFREFYDEDYILHSAMEGSSEDDYLVHGKLLNAIHKYIKKWKNRHGNWVYQYPEQNVGKTVRRILGENKAIDEYNNRQAREADYNYENKKSGVGLFKRRNSNAMAGDSRYKAPSNNAMAGDSRYKGKHINVNNMPHNDPRYKANPSNVYAQQQKKGNAGTAKYNERKEREKRQLAAAKANKMYYDKGTQAKAKAKAAKKREDQYDFYLTQYGHGPKKYKKYGTKKKW